jgi:hypothetical protein
MLTFKAQQISDSLELSNSFLVSCESATIESSHNFRLIITHLSLKNNFLNQF